MMNVLKTPFGPVRAGDLPADYTSFLRRGALQGAQDRRRPPPVRTRLLRRSGDQRGRRGRAPRVMADLGATIVDPVDTGDTYAWYDHEFTVLLYEFVGDVARLPRRPRPDRHALAGRPHPLQPGPLPGRDEVLRPGGVRAGRGDRRGPADPAYLEARAESLRLARDEGIDRVMAEHDLDAVVSPSYAFGSSAPAVAGYPTSRCRSASRTTAGRPGSGCTAGFLDEPKLLAYSYDLEQALGARPHPRTSTTSSPSRPTRASARSQRWPPAVRAERATPVATSRDRVAGRGRWAAQAMVVGRIARPTR